MARAAVNGHGERGALRDRLGVYGLGMLLIVAAFVVTYQFVDPAPPSRIVIASGQAGGAYHEFALRYAEILARSRIEVEVRATAGSAENLALLTDPDAGVDLALVQGGIASPDDEMLLSLGAMFYEPLWVFVRDGVAVDRITGLEGLRIATGQAGSGTDVIARELLAANALDGASATFVPLSMAEAASALRKGEVDVAMMVASPESDVVAGLIAAPGVGVMDLARADAYARRWPFLSALVLPEGMLDLVRNHPPRATRLLAPTANMVVTRDFHPALVDLLLSAAAEVHGDHGMFRARGQFPTPDYQALALSPDAERHYAYGPPFLQRVLPFWAATLVDRLKVMLLPLVGLMLPLMRIMPPVYQWRIRSRIYRWYRELRAVDPELARPGTADDVAGYLRELDRIEHEVTRVDVPLSYTDELYDLRRHIEMVRRKLMLLAERAG